MNVLLRFDGYPPAVAFAVLLHLVLVWFFLDRNLSPSDMVTIEPASIAVATARESPQRLRRLEQVRSQQQAAEQRARDEAAAREAARQREAAAQAEAERRRQEEARRQVEQQRQAEAARQEEARQAEARRRAEEEARRAAELQRQREAEQRAQELARQQAEQERQARARAESARVSDDLVAQYTALIHDLISQNWVIPPSARNDMQALVRLTTTPVGDIVSVVVLQSSGNDVFDRSVLQAVERVDNLQELQDLPIDVYERNFREFNLLFKPEDLLR